MRIPANRLDPTDDVGPFEPGPEHIIAIGLRNPWRMHLDEESGSLWVGDVGAGAVESVNVLRRGEDDQWIPANFGWPLYEGPSALRDDVTLDDVTFPAFHRSHAEDVCAIIGGFVYRHSTIRELEGAYLYGDYCSNELRAVVIGSDGSVQADGAIARLAEPLVSIVPAPDGTIIALGAFGAVYAVGAPGSDSEDRSTVPAPVALDPGDLCRLQDAFFSLGEFETLDAADLRRHFTSAHAATASMAATGDRAATEVRGGLTHAISVGDAAEWAPDAPEVQGLLPALTDVTGEFPYFQLATFELLQRVPDEC